MVSRTLTRHHGFLTTREQTQLEGDIRMNELGVVTVVPLKGQSKSKPPGRSEKQAYLSAVKRLEG